MPQTIICLSLTTKYTARDELILW